MNDGAPTLLPLPTGTTEGVVDAAAASGSNVYMAGEADNNTTIDDAAYWVNGVLTPLTLPNGTTESAVYGIAVQ